MSHITTVLTVSTATIPSDVQSGLFCCWQLTPAGKKQPINPHTGKSAKTSDPTTFSDYQIALKCLGTYPGHSGIGRLLTYDADSIIAIDVDNCVIDGNLNGYAADLVRRAHNYAEYSPSGHGIRIFVQGRLPGALADNCSVKIWEKHTNPDYYDIETQLFIRGQYVTVTGHQLTGTPTVIANNQTFIDYVLASNPDKDYYSAVPAVRASGAAAKTVTGNSVAEINTSEVNFHQVNSRIRHMCNTSTIFCRNWFRHSTKPGDKSNSEYCRDLVVHAYVRYQMDTASLWFMLTRWFDLHDISADAYRHRLKHWMKTAQRELSEAQAKGRRTFREHETERKRKYRASKRTLPPNTTTTVGIRDMPPHPATAYGDRRLQILKLLESGMSQVKVAAELGISRRTVRKTIEREKAKQAKITGLPALDTGNSDDDECCENCPFCACPRPEYFESEPPFEPLDLTPHELESAYESFHKEPGFFLDFAPDKELPAFLISIEIFAEMISDLSRREFARRLEWTQESLEWEKRRAWYQDRQERKYGLIIDEWGKAVIATPENVERIEAEYARRNRKKQRRKSRWKKKQQMLAAAA